MTNSQKPDHWNWPTSILFLMVIGFFSYEAFTAINNRRDIFEELNSLQRTCTQHPDKAEQQLQRIKARVIKAQSSNFEQVMSVAGQGFPDINEHCAVIYKKLGDKYASKNDYGPVIRNYSYCLLHNPNMKYLALDLGQACMKTGNNELGYYAGLLHQKENNGHSIFLKHFSKRFKPKYQ